MYVISNYWHLLIYFCQVFDQIATKKTKEEQLEEAVNLLSDLPLNKDELKTAAKLFYGKLFVSFYYKPEQKFNGSVTLVTAKDNFVSLEPDYGLKPVSITWL